MTAPYWTFILAIVIAAAFEVYANILLVKSDGFTLRPQAFGALLFVALAFTCLAYAIQRVDLAIAYALWGGFGILGTSIGGWLIFGQRLHFTAWLGIAFLIGGMALLHFF